MTPPPRDPGTPHSARVTTYLLGGKDHLAADRAAADQLLAHAPTTLNAVREVRLFGHRAVQWLAYRGVTQFIDLGCGLPLPDGLTIHEIAYEANPAARVVYVDNDPIVLAHARALLTVNAQTTVVNADLTYPADVLEHPLTHAMLDVEAPVAVLCLSVGHLMADHARHRTLTALATLLPAGSVLVYGQLAAANAQASRELHQTTRDAGLHWHIPPTATIDQTLHHLSPITPGLGNLNRWRPHPHQQPLPTPDLNLHLLLDTGIPELVLPYGGVLHVAGASLDLWQET